MYSIRVNKNIAAKGGCAEVVSSQFGAFNSAFTENVAIRGGVIFAIQKTTLQIVNCQLSRNLATDGGIIYSMSNKFSFDGNIFADSGQRQAIGLYQSEISNNWAAA